jgi:ankyrin repeat protein
MPTKNNENLPLYPVIQYRSPITPKDTIELKIIKLIYEGTSLALKKLEKIIVENEIKMNWNIYSFDGYKLDYSSGKAVPEPIAIHGLTLLHLACLLASPSSVKFLIARGVKVNQPDFNGNIPLTYALLPDKEEKIEIIKTLLASGSNLSNSGLTITSPLENLYSHLSNKNYFSAIRLELAKTLIEHKLVKPQLLDIMKNIVKDTEDQTLLKLYNECVEAIEEYSL